MTTRISILYPYGSAARFDFDYYLGTHMPLSIGLLSRHPGFSVVLIFAGASL